MKLNPQDFDWIKKQHSTAEPPKAAVELASGGVKMYDPESGEELKPLTMSDIAEMPGISEAVMNVAAEISHRLAQTIDALCGASADITGAKMPLEVDSKTAWEKKLEEQEKEVLAAEAAQAPNAKQLRFEYLQKKQSFLKTQIVELKKAETKAEKIGNSSVVAQYYNSKLLDNLKAQTPFSTAAKDYAPAAKPVSTPVKVSEPEFIAPKSGEMDEQKFIMRVGMMSNCNVNIQSKKLGTFSAYGGSFSSNRVAYRLLCDSCGQSQAVDNAVVERHQHDDAGLMEFCKKHRHIPGASEEPVVEGRRFKDGL